jgi:FkbM family methyltransferase
LAAEIAALERTLQRTKSQNAVARRERPSVSLMQQTAAHRRQTIQARVAARRFHGREEQLVRVSPSYRAALEGSNSMDAVSHHMVLDGLSWRVPFRIGDSSLPRAWIAKQRLPYHGIAQTREVAMGGIMLDIGANTGRMAIPRVILGDVVVAYCAEPDPTTFACLARNVIDNDLRGLVLPDQTAIGDRNGTVRLLRAGPSGNFRVVDEERANMVEVPCSTLDTWVDRLDIDLDAVTFVKVDVEGFEQRVLAGARRVLARRHIAWQVEIKLPGLRAVGDDPQAVYADLRRSFTHFIDLNRRAAGCRVRPVSEIVDALRYIERDGKTDVLLFSAPA